MSIITTTGITVTHDESAGFQNFSVAAPASDADDNDINVSLPGLALPTAFTLRLTSLLNGTAATEVLIGSALSGYDATHLTGQNVVTLTPTPGGQITGLAFTDASGAPLNGVDSGKNTADGTDILLYTDTENNNILVGRAGGPTGAIVFAAYIEETLTGTAITGGKIWVTQYGAMEHADTANPDDFLDLTGLVYVGTSQDTNFSLEGAPSGNNLFLMFTQANPTIVGGRISDVTIIATGKDPANQSGDNPNSTADDVNINTGDTIVSSQAGGANNTTTFGTNSQMITEQEGIRFSFVTGARADVTIPNLNQTEANLESNIDFTATFGARVADFDIVQLQSGKSAQVKITAYSTATESGTSFIDGYAGDATVTIVGVRVLNSVNNAVIETFSNGAEGGLSSAIAISITGGVATITGVEAGQSIEYTTTADHNRVLIENGAALNATGNTHADFDIGGFRLLQVSTETAEVGSKIIFDDDGPSIVVADTAPPDALTVDESDLATNASASFADNFSSTPSYGADGAGTVSSAYALSLKASGADSGLVDVATGNSVFLFLNASGVVEGREGTSSATASGGAIVFTASVSATGTVTLDQQRAIVHPITTNPDDSKTLGAADLIVLTRTDTVTDKDGDQSTGSDFLNIGQALNFEDDGPSIVVADTAPPDALTVDESDLATNASASFADNFSSTPSYGADGAGTVSSAYALSVKSPGVASGLVDTLSNQSVVLTVNASGVVEGRTASSSLLVFTVSVSATGTVTLDQQRAIVHPITTNPDDSKTLGAADLIVLTRTDTITDKDGDQSTGSDFLNIGQALNFEDDGPSIVVADTAPPDALTVDESDLATNASASFADNFSSTPNYGADGAGTVSSAYALSLKASGADSGLVDVATGNSVFLFLNASGVVEGREGTSSATASGGAIVFTASVSATGTVTLDQQRAIVHPITTNPDDSKTLGAADLIVLTRTDTITDKDGDQSTGSDFLNIGQALNFEDDGPSIVVADTAPPDALTVDESDLATNASASFADNFSSTPSYGADGAGTVSSAYALSVKSPGVASGLVDTLSNQSVVLTVNASGVVEGRTASSSLLVFTVSVSATGTVTLDQQRAIVHPITTNPDDSKTLGAADLIVLTRTDTITDKDGDQSTGSDFLNIGQALNFEDDGPSIVVADTAPPDTLTVDETDLATNASASFADNFSSTPSYGADGAGTVSSAYALSVKSPGVASGLVDTLSNQSVVLTVNASGVVEGRTASSSLLVFTVSVSAAGTVTLDQQRAIVHPITTNPDDSKTLGAADLIVLTRTDTVTDKDGDQSTGSDFLNIGQALNFEDDGPSIAFGNLVGTGTDLPQYGFWTKAAGTDGPNAADLQIALTGFQLGGVAQPAANFSLTEGSPSPDGSGNYKWTGSLTGDFDNNGTVDATPLTFSLTAQADGKYVLDLNAPVQSTTTTDTATGALGAGGPDPVQTLAIPATPTSPAETVVFFSAKIGASASAIATGVITGATDPTEASLQGNNPPATLASFIDPRSMNVSTAGIGVDNNNMNGYGASGSSAIIDDPAGNAPADDSFVVNPLALTDKVRVFIDNSVTGYDYTGGERMQYRIIYADGSVSDYTTVVGDLGKGAAPKFFEIDGAGQKIDAVQITMLYGEVKIPNIQFVTVTESLAKDISLDFTASLTDGDGDTASSAFSADLFTNEAANATFDYELVGTANAADAFDVDLFSTRNDYSISGFDTTAGARDKIVLVGDATAQVSFVNGPDAADNSIVTIVENGGAGQTTTLTVIGVDLQAGDVVFA